MKGKIFLIFTFLFLFTTCLFAEYFHIEDYNVNVILNKDSSVYFEENIHVVFHTHRHGIFRWIPYKWGSVKFRNKILKIEASSNGVNFSKEKYMKKYYKNFIFLRIGRKNRTFIRDRYYRIVYKIDNGIVNDQFYWNVIGTGWKVPIKHANISIQFPEIGDIKRLKYFVFKGLYGSRKTLIYNISESDMTINDVSLKPREGITVRLIFPKNFFYEIPISKKIIWWLSDNFGYFIPIVVFIILFLIWSKYGKDEKKGPIVVRYEPPEDLTPAEVGTLIDDRVDNKDITATIIGLADKGYLKIEKQEDKVFLFNKEKIILRKLKIPGFDLKKHEVMVFDGIFGGVEEYIDLKDLKKYFYSTAKRSKDYMYKYITDTKHLYTHNPQKVRAVLMVIAPFFLFFGIAINQGVHADLFIGNLISGALIFLFAFIMPKKSHLGSQLYREILGFKEFIEKVEKDRLERLAADDPNIFSKILPYAIAFGLEKKWSKKFENINISPPHWYGGYYYAGGFSTSDFISSLNKDLASISSSVTSGSSSSGGSGGGFSGGGGGGGGGGSW